MSTIGDRIKSIFTVGYDDDYEDDYYDDYEDDDVLEEEEEEVIVEKKPSRQKRERTVAQEEVTPKTTRATSSFGQSRSTRSSRSSKVVPMRGSSDMEVCVIKPTYYESTRDIIDTLLDGKSVVLNLEGMKLDLAQRIVDSVSGGCYAIQGNLQKISGYIYLVTPKSVDITGDFQDLVGGSDVSDYSSPYSGRNY